MDNGYHYLGTKNVLDPAVAEDTQLFLTSILKKQREIIATDTYNKFINDSKNKVLSSTILSTLRKLNIISNVGLPESCCLSDEESLILKEYYKNIAQLPNYFKLAEIIIIDDFVDDTTDINNLIKNRITALKQSLDKVSLITFQNNTNPYIEDGIGRINYITTLLQ